MQIMAKSCLLAYERLQVVQKVVQKWPEGHFHMGWHFDSITNGAPCLPGSLVLSSATGTVALP